MNAEDVTDGLVAGLLVPRRLEKCISSDILGSKFMPSVRPQSKASCRRDERIAQLTFSEKLECWLNERLNFVSKMSRYHVITRSDTCYHDSAFHLEPTKW